MILLDNVIPEPLAEIGLNPDSQIWATDCNFEKGKKYLVTAPSGKGKSTLIHLLYGIRSDYEGDINIEAKNIRSLANNTWSDLRQKSLSIVFQNLRLFPQLTAVENLLLKATITEDADLELINSYASRLGVEDYLNQSTQTLSYGQRQRFAIIRALLQPFDLLLLDEPFSHLDDANIEAAVDLILEVCEKNEAGLILVSLNEKYGIEYDEEFEL